ncbi:MAG TPA: queuosine salvage family protein [Solirubrobacteraceae bacterium]|nr:queuosine salvage family protein [Solirubrobacteraceae bacterium]
MDDLRSACAEVARRARHVRVVPEAIAPAARELAPAVRALARAADGLATTTQASAPAADAGATSRPAEEAQRRERLAAAWLTLGAINFGSGWFPTLRKRPGMSGARTIAAALWERFDAWGCWPASALEQIEPDEVAATLGQDPRHELMALYAASLRDLGGHVRRDHGGSFAAVLDAAGSSAVSLARLLGRWASFADEARHGELRLPFLKRAQLAAADLHRAKAASFGDLPSLTMFADNLVPHVLRLDGVLRYSPALLERIERGELLEHGCAEEVEIRACAVHAVELLVKSGAGGCAAEVDEALWNRGQLPRYKAIPRHRCRTTAY